MKTKRTLVLGQNVAKTGAPTGAVLTGVIRSNDGLRVRVFESQPRGEWGPLRGAFEILDAGDNMHTEALTPLVGRSTDAALVLAIIRSKHPLCVNVVNATILMLEKP